MEKYTYPTKDFTLSGDDPTFTVLAGVQVVCKAIRLLGIQQYIRTYDSMTGDNYGFSIDCDYPGRNVVIGAINASVANQHQVL